MNVVSLITQLAEQDIRLWLENGNLRYSAPDGAMTAEIISQLRGAKSTIIEFLQQSEQQQTITLPVADRETPLAISYAQQRLWFIHQLDPANTAYHIHVALNIKGPLRADYISKACTEIVRRHEILRTHYRQQGGNIIQIIRPPFTCTIDTENTTAEALPAALHKELHTPFQLDGEIFRVRLWQIADSEYALSFTIHHIAADGWSLGIFVNELVQCYSAFSQGQTPALPPLERQYADYALWQTQNVAQHEQQLQYWQNRLAAVPNLSLPYDAPPNTYIGNEGSAISANLDQAATAKLQQFNKAQGTTLFMTMLGGLSVLLHRYSQQSDFCIGTPVAGRSTSQVEGLIGCFLNVLALRCQPQPEQTFSEYLQTLKATCTEAFAHQDMPFERIVQEVVQERDLAISPLFQVMLSVQNTPINAVTTLDGLDIAPYTETVAAAQFDLKLTVQEHEGQLVLLFEYKKALFKTATINRFAEHFVTLLHNLTSAPDLPLHKAALFDHQHQQTLLGLQQDGWNHTATEWPAGESVLSLFEQQVANTPQAIAISSPTRQLSYAQFNAQVNRLAHYLSEKRQIKAPARIVICQKADVDFLVAVYATIKMGACYIPVDASYPDDRIRHIIADAGAELVITDRLQQERLQLDSRLGLCMADIQAELQHYPADNPGITINAEDSIYCIYTSGSTGVPKGVEVKHQGESNLIHWYTREFAFDQEDKCLIIAAIGFDLTQKNFFAPLCSGGEIVFHGLDYYDPQAIARLIAAKNISVINCAPSAFYPLIQHPDNKTLLHSLRIVLLGGEPIRVETVKPWLHEVQFACELVNMYGPTECTDIASIYRIRSIQDLDTNIIPIGHAIANTQLHILDNHQELLPLGAVGELYIGGSGLAKGYVNNKALTDRSFIHNPFIAYQHPSQRLYRTGDLVRYNTDGNIEYIARTDHQVKIRGLRIELGEIESRLQKISGIKESIVIARNKPDTANDQILIAYYVADDQAISTATIRHQLLLELPQYMIPAYFIALPSWPLSNNGKIDRKALPEPDWSQLNRRPYVAPATATQTTLASIWSEVLGLENIGIHDSFFELGGHSLTATQALSKAQEAFAVEIPLRQIFENPTIEAIAELIDTALLENAVFNRNTAVDDDAESFIL